MTTFPPLDSGSCIPMPGRFAARLRHGNLTEIYALLYEVAAHPLSVQADTFLKPEALCALQQALSHVVPSRCMRPQAAAPLAFALHAIKEAILREPNPRRRIFLAHEAVDRLLLKTKGICVGKRVATLHSLDAMDGAAQGMIDLLEVSASVLRDRHFLLARLGVGAGWFGADRGVSARLRKTGPLGSGGHITRARFGILRNALERGDEIKRALPGTAPLFDVNWLRREQQQDFQRVGQIYEERAEQGAFRFFAGHASD